MYFVHFVSAKNKQYFYNNFRNEPVGPLSVDQLRSLADMGRIGQHTWVKEKHQTEWKKLSDLLREEANAEETLPKNPRITNFSPEASTSPSPTPTPIPIPVAKPPSNIIPKPSFVRAQPQLVFIKEKEKEEVELPPHLRRPKSARVRKTDEQPVQPKPVNYDLSKIQEISNTSTISGIVNIIIGCIWLGLGSVFASINFAFALPPALYGIMTGIFEIAYASDLLVKQTASLRQARILALLSIFSICCGNIISGILGLKNLMSYNDYRVRAFFETS